MRVYDSNEMIDDKDKSDVKTTAITWEVLKKLEIDTIETELLSLEHDGIHCTITDKFGRFLLVKKTNDWTLLTVFACIGGTLRDLIGTKLTEDQLLDYFTQIAITLKPLHDVNLAFGHVHPGNFFFDPSKKSP